MKAKTESMLLKIFEHMRASRLLINAGKTKVLLFATPQKRAKNDLSFGIDIEGKHIKEIDHATLLGIELSNNFSWDRHVDAVLKECSQKLNGMYKVRNELNVRQRKSLAEGSILSRLRYALVVVSSGTDSNIKRLEGMQSKCARYVLGVARKEWSRTQGYAELQWMTIPQLAVEATIRLLCKVLWEKKPKKLFDSVFDEE